MLVFVITVAVAMYFDYLTPRYLISTSAFNHEARLVTRGGIVHPAENRHLALFIRISKKQVSETRSLSWVQISQASEGI